jgi:hypothetical protein
VQYGSNAVEDQFARLQELGDVATEEVNDRLGNNFEGQGIASIDSDELLPGTFPTLQTLI